MLKNLILKRAQKKINFLEPKVNIHLNKELPSPSVKEIASLAKIVSKVNSFEPELASQPDSFFSPENS